MSPRRAEKAFTPSPQDLQELFDLPSSIPQRDLAEILQAEARLKIIRDEVASLRAQLVEELVLGLPIDPGQLKAELDSNGRAKIIQDEEEPCEALKSRLRGSVPF